MGWLRDECKLRLPTSGLEFLEWMNSQDNLKANRVFTLSSSSEPSELERAHMMGVNGYRSKQGNVAVLVEICGRKRAECWANKATNVLV